MAKGSTQTGKNVSHAREDGALEQAKPHPLHVDARGLSFSHRVQSSLPVHPAQGPLVPQGNGRDRLWGWPGAGVVTNVQLNLGVWEARANARLDHSVSPYPWRCFEHSFDVEAPGREAPGHDTARARARAAAGAAQADAREWTRRGYGNHAIEVRELHVH